mgnify:CR=1 FL=1|jgi:preprotein translocase subunit Sec61beta
MANDQQISMPNSGSGLTMFFDEDSSSYKIDPKAAMITMTVITLLVSIAHGVAA